LQANGEPRLAIFSWDGISIVRAIVYDESDEIVLPADQQSEGWKRRAAKTELSCGFTGAPLGDHFYIVVMGC